MTTKPNLNSKSIPNLNAVLRRTDQTRDPSTCSLFVSCGKDVTSTRNVTCVFYLVPGIYNWGVCKYGGGYQKSIRQHCSTQNGQGWGLGQETWGKKKTNRYCNMISSSSARRLPAVCNLQGPYNPSINTSKKQCTTGRERESNTYS